MGRARPCPKVRNETDLGKVLFNIIAEVAQLVEHDLAKVGVAGSSPVFRSIGGTPPFHGELPVGKSP